eukprot:367584-Prymnesium_polylepis.1
MRLGSEERAGTRAARVSACAGWSVRLGTPRAAAPYAPWRQTTGLFTRGACAQRREQPAYIP